MNLGVWWHQNFPLQLLHARNLLKEDQAQDIARDQDMHHNYRGYAGSNAHIVIAVSVERLHNQELEDDEDHHGKQKEDGQEEQQSLHSLDEIFGSPFLEGNLADLDTERILISLP